MEKKPNRKILVIDDNLAIHADFEKTLLDSGAETADFAGAEAALFDDAPAHGSLRASDDPFTLEFAAQGREGYD
ncbi:MAG TPA: hypothetical protein VM509_07220, partial [Planctomycetota bacterium]|nr:hypothetical protein [Planctomycetota bacterium]